jgi:hypothetical protein
MRDASTADARANDNDASSIPRDDASVVGPGSDASSANGCAEFCGFLRRAGCPNLPPPVQPAQCVETCNARLYMPACDAVWRGMLRCYSTAAPSMLMCMPGGDDILVPSCEAPAAAALGCMQAVNDPRCYGAVCEDDGDCPSRCNRSTGRCYESRDSRACVGLPCSRDGDCPSRCNQAVGACYDATS